MPTINGPQISELQNIDFSFGAHLLKAFETHDTGYGPKQFQEFMARDQKRQIYRSEQVDPPGFINAIRLAGTQGEKTPGGTLVGGPELPVLYYFREPGFDPGEDKEAYRDMVVENDITGTAFDVLMFPAVFDYQLRIVSWDKPTLDKLSLLLFAHLYRSHTFDVHYSIGGEEYDPISAWVKESRSIAFVNESEPVGERRLWVVNADLQLQTNIVMCDAITVPDNVYLQFVTCGFCGDLCEGEQIFDEAGCCDG